MCNELKAEDALLCSREEKFRGAIFLPHTPSVLSLDTTRATFQELKKKNILGLPGFDPDFTDMYALLEGTV